MEEFNFIGCANIIASNPAVPAFFHLQEKKLGRLGSRLQI